jgi:hypothetical protein
MSSVDPSNATKSTFPDFNKLATVSRMFFWASAVHVNVLDVDHHRPLGTGVFSKGNLSHASVGGRERGQKVGVVF